MDQAQIWRIYQKEQGYSAKVKESRGGGCCNGFISALNTAKESVIEDSQYNHPTANTHREAEWENTNWTHYPRTVGWYQIIYYMYNVDPKRRENRVEKIF